MIHKSRETEIKHPASEIAEASCSLLVYSGHRFLAVSKLQPANCIVRPTLRIARCLASSIFISMET